MFSALFCPDYIRCGGNGGTLGECQPCWAEPWGEERGGGWAGGGRAKGKKGWMRGEKRRGRWGQYAWRRREKGREGWDGTEATGVPRTSRDQKVGRGAVWFIKTSERPDLWAGGWMWRGSLVVAQRGTDGKWHDRIFFFFFPLSSARGHAALIKSALPITSCPERKSSRGRGWCTKLMEDVTNHKIYDKSILSSNHANNLECVCVFFFNNNTVCSSKTQSQESFKACSHTALIISHQ